MECAQPCIYSPSTTSTSLLHVLIKKYFYSLWVVHLASCIAYSNMVVVDLELQEGFFQSDGTDSGDLQWDFEGPSQHHGDPNYSDGTTSKGEFRSIQQALDFSDLELVQRTRHGTWCLVHHRHGGLGEASTQPLNGGRGAFHGIGRAGRAKGHRLSRGVLVYTNPSPLGGSFLPLKQVPQHRCGSKR